MNDLRGLHLVDKPLPVRCLFGEDAGVFEAGETREKLGIVPGDLP